MLFINSSANFPFYYGKKIEYNLLGCLYFSLVKTSLLIKETRYAYINSTLKQKIQQRMTSLQIVILVVMALDKNGCTVLAN